MSSRQLEHFYAMRGKFADLRQQTSDVILNMDNKDIYFWQLEKGFSDIRTIISKRIKK